MARNYSHEGYIRRNRVPRKLKADVGDIVMVNGREMEVVQVVTQAHATPLTRSHIVVSPIDKLTGRLLTRTTIHAGEHWRHIWEE